ncbi:MAG: FkbM family methyltransferase [Methylomarinum sp.]|nr:FkbM family methyltransferase [Methylomarinum sp.]
MNSNNINTIKQQYWKIREYSYQIYQNPKGLFKKLFKYLSRPIRTIWHTYNRTIVDAGGGVLIRIQPAISNSARCAIVSRTYEKPELISIEAKLTKDDIVMELGTGIGFISTYCAKKIGSNRVHTFEANPDLEEIIRDTFHLNNVSPSLQMCILGESNGTTEFFTNPNFSASSIYRTSKKSNCINVPMRSANEEIKKISPTFLILDIEGAEYSLFKHIDLNGIHKIGMELHDHIIGNEKAEEILSILKSKGFSENPIYSSNRAIFLERY